MTGCCGAQRSECINQYVHSNRDHFQEVQPKVQPKPSPIFFRCLQKQRTVGLQPVGLQPVGDLQPVGLQQPVDLQPVGLPARWPPARRPPARRPTRP